MGGMPNRTSFVPILSTLALALAACAEPEPEPAQPDGAPSIAPTESSCPDDLGVRVDGWRLAFIDGAHLVQTYRCLHDAYVAEGDAALVRFERTFPDYRSKRLQIVQETDALVARDALTVANLPNATYVGDPILRTLVNAGAELVVGDEVIVLDDTQFSGGDGGDGGGGGRGGCCWMYRQVSRWDYDGDKALRSTTWVVNPFPIPGLWFGAVGSTTEAFRLQYGDGGPTLAPVKAMRITAGAGYRYAVGTCDSTVTDDSYGTIAHDAYGAVHVKPYYTFLLPFFVTQAHMSSHLADFAGGPTIDVDLSLCEDDPPPTPMPLGYRRVSLIQGTLGAAGNFEGVASRMDGGLQHVFRLNDATPPTWHRGEVFASGQFWGVAMIQSNYGGADGDFEVVAARDGGGLQHFRRDNHWPYEWHAGATFGGTSLYRAVAMIQSSLGQQGDFEVIVALASGGLQHFRRDNDNVLEPVWVAGPVFGTGIYRGVSLIQSDYGSEGNFEVVASRDSGGLEHFYRDNDAASPEWSAGHTFVGGPHASVSLVQSTYGPGNFEVVAMTALGLRHYYRSGLTWHVGPLLGAGARDVSLIQSTLGAPGDFQIVTVPSAPGLRPAHRDNDDAGMPWSWTAPF